MPQESERISLYQQLDNMEKPEQTELFRAHLKDRFGPIPEISEELVKVVPLRMAARRLGIERLVLKNGSMRLFFVGADNKAYYNSTAFGKVLAFVQAHPRQCELREVKGKNSILISDVPSVSSALDILKEIEASSPI